MWQKKRKTGPRQVRPHSLDLGYGYGSKKEDMPKIVVNYFY